MKVEGKKPSGQKNDRGKPAKGKHGGLVWHNPKPSSEDVAWLDGDEDNHVANVVTLVDGLRDDERISVKLDLHSGRWLAILFDDVTEDGRGAQALSVRGASSFDALVLLHYFHHVKFAGGWAADAVEVEGRFG